MKRNYWPLFFVGIFSFVFSMIVWTISKAVSVPTVEDRSFMKKYQDVDEHFNVMMESNQKFLSKYNFEMYLNDKEFDLTTEDIKYSQRVIEKYSENKNLLKIGQNNIKIVITDKVTKEKKDVKIDLVVSKTMTNDSDISISNDNFTNANNTFSSNFDIKEANNWIITGSFNVDETIGYIYIKTNAI
ncbi:hypothetical protein [Aliarcobacter butzleri]|uniref:Cytochrome c oxidase-associated protein CcoH n=2 Tax=root TaxID=1 RepID=A0A837J7S9_9BACT|nr:hypothetical protein [Aliarcobacter butzleri]KLD98712.1 hypothetical protein AF74_02365 [Aliarcobacter butzleri L349]KLE02377.1 hypothetical protein AF76_01865 [Aliarcobacter butzleri L351]KLE13466.1 hypothetical protein AF75_03065 [Aliarcobacter butzleri L350]MDH1976785.1 hypothetical protein [Aliarcobacter butzleri]MDN5047777.1 hypothetical protein [Aliarcobacter butzleri]